MPDRLDVLLQFYEEDPSDAFTRFALAHEYLKRGDEEQARTFLEALMRDAPDYTGTYYHLGKLYERLGRPGDARVVYERGIEAARRTRNQKDLSELQDALLQLDGVGFDDADA